SYDASNLLDRNRPPVFLGGDWKYPLGTDGLGRDLLARLVFGTRISIGLAFVGTIIGALVGTVLGLIAARMQNFVGGLIGVAIDLQDAISFLIVELAAYAVLGNALVLLVSILTIDVWETYAWLVRGNALSAHTLPILEAARTCGVSPLMTDVRNIMR